MKDTQAFAAAVLRLQGAPYEEYAEGDDDMRRIRL